MTDLGSFVDDHPLYAEFKSLRTAVARFQDEAHASAIKFQRHTLDSSHLHERAVHLERENDILKAEIALLRANPHPDATQIPPDSAQKISELTLSLRRLSQKLDVTEQSLLEKTTELTTVQAELGRARLSAENAYALGARVRGREESALSRERDLEWQLKEKEEQRRILELAVGEYASLVRSLETKLKGETSSRSSGSSAHQNGYAFNSLSSTLLEGKIGLQRLVGEFQKETEAIQVRLDEALAEVDVLKAQDDASKKGNKLVEEELGRVKTELEKLKIEDNTAAKMVSRYMQFSQRSTNSLQTALASLKTRHEATLNTLTSQSFDLTARLRSSEATVSRLRDALDELGLEIMKETYGRRREVTQRLKLLNREERMMEALRRWGRRAEEAVSRLNFNTEEGNDAGSQEALLVMAQDARILLEGLDEGVMDESSAAFASGSKARWILGQSTIDELLEELRVETERRIRLEKVLAVQEEAVVTSNGTDHVLQNDHAKAIEPVSLVDDVVISSPPAGVYQPSNAPVPPVSNGISIQQPAPRRLPEIPKDIDTALHIPETLSVVHELISINHKPLISPDLKHKPLPDIVDLITTSESQDQDQKETLKQPAQPDTQSQDSSLLTEDVPIATPGHAPASPPLIVEPIIPESDEPKQHEAETSAEILEPISRASPSLDADIPSPPVHEPTNPYPSPPVEEIIPNVPVLPPPAPESLSLEELVDIPIADTGSDSSQEPLPDVSSDSVVETCPQERTSQSKEETSSENTPPPSSQPEVICEDNAPSQSKTPIQSSHSILPEISNCEKLSVSLESKTIAVSAESPKIPTVTIERPPSANSNSESTTLELVNPPVPVETPGSTTVTVSTPSPPPPAPPTPPPERHPLLAELSRVSKRYDILQRSFRDCHLALESLKSSLREQAASKDLGGHTLPPEVFRAALDRMDDYTEDARVELEIRVSDEALLIRGYETLLSVPGAFSSTMTKREELAVLDQDDDEPTQNEVELQIQAFVDGADPAVKRAHDTFTRKLEDVQHDIAALKRAIHDPDALLPPAPSTPDFTSPIPTPSSSTFNLALSGAQKSDDSSAKGGWTSWIRGGTSRPSSPAPQSSTFGSIMTAPRLRPSPSTTSLQSNNQQSQSLGYGVPPGTQRAQASGQRRGSFLGSFGMGASSQADTKHDPLGALALRVPMPNFGRLISDARNHTQDVAQPPSAGVPTPQSAYGFNLGLGFSGMSAPSPTTPLAPGSAAPMRARTVSTMYMLGLGASASGNSSSASMRGRTVSAAGGFGGLSSPGLMSRQNSQTSSSSFSSSSGVSGSVHSYGSKGGVGLEKVDAGETDVENTDAESDGDGDDDIE